MLFDGQTSYVEIADSADFSVATTGQLSVSACIRPDVLTFPAFQSTGYIHWMGKGAQGQQEWVFRMYNETTTDNPPRPNRISFYVFNPLGGEGIGSHFRIPCRRENGSTSSASPMGRQPRSIRTACSAIATVTPAPAPDLATIIRRAFG